VADLSERPGLRQILSDPALRVIMFVVFVIMIGFGIVAPVLPLFARSFGVGYDAAGLLISSFAITRLAFDLFAGPIVDRWGERASATAALLFVALSSFLTAAAPNFTLAVIFRGAGGAGSSLLFAAVYSYLLKVVPSERMARAAGLFYGSFNIGIIAGSPLGGLIAGAFNLRAPLYFYGGLLVVSAVLFQGIVRDPPRKERVEPALSPQEVQAESVAPIPRTARARIGALMRDPRFVTVAITNFAYLWMVAAVFDTLIPLFGRDHLHMSTTAIGGVFALGLAAELMLMYPSGVAADRVGRKAIGLLTFTWLVAAGSAVGLASSPALFALLFAAFGTGSGSSSVIPTAMLSDVAPKDASGTAVGVFRFAGDLGLVLGPLVAGFTTNALGFHGSFPIALAPCAIALVLIARMPETLKRG
jgi:DHA1 family multidrug resistance protein-like MFS transporter